MKKILLLLVLALAPVFSIHAQTGDTPEQKNARVEIAKMNNQLIALFKQKNYDEALKLGLGAWSIAEKNALTKDLKVVPTLSNLAEIYFIKDKYAEAAISYSKALDVYETSSGNQDSQIVKIAERLAVIYFLKKDYGRTEEMLLKALPLREKLNGAESREAAKLNRDLGDIFWKKNDYRKAGEFYLKAVTINDKVMTEAEKKNREDVSNYKCLLYHKGLSENDIKGVSEQIKAFEDARKDASDKSVYGGVVNGKAVNLVKPVYPMNMRGASGFAMVQVTIDEQGKVISAKASCGIQGFVEAVEEAARKSKFSPTLIAGQPVKVTGVIVYNFIR